MSTKDKKGKELNNWNEVNVEKKKKEDRLDIFRGSGGAMPKDQEKDDKGNSSHSHTVIKDGKVVYDRDEYGTVFIDTDKGDKATDTN